ncbi:restriction endonuclease subunit S [Teredinibacter turnerae]|uniref:restriction endonuclease subunit S n=1 Tax=Teredinibacter turnerae TaxID=2426 RepID=UPI000ADE8C0D|nr:restriction endonuclease subunit S [Teredinibacter turnerae]
MNVANELNMKIEVVNWTNPRIGDICEAINGKTFKSSEWATTGLPIIRIQNLKSEESAFNYYNKDLEDKYKVENGDLLFAWSGTPGTSFGAHIWKGSLAALNQHIFRIDFDQTKIDKKYFCSALNYCVAGMIENAQGGVGLAHITKSKFMETKLPLPPLNEQHRIVAKIEELFSELDKGIESLKTAREQLKVYRQSLLKHAFEGKLTEQWRKDNAGDVHGSTSAAGAGSAGAAKLETADELLARIQQEREARYQQQLEDWTKAVKEWEEMNKVGKSPPRPKKPAPLNVHETNKSDLPEGWKRVSLEALLAFGPINGWSPKAIDEPTSTKAITLTATTSGKFDGTKYKYIDTEIPKHSSLWLKHNDILVQRGNTIEYVGVPCLYSGEDNQFIYPDLMMKIQTADSARSQYVVSCMGTVEARNYLRSRAVGAAGSMPKINQQTLSSLPIPLCSVAEQNKITEILDERISICDSCSDYIDEQLRKIESLRQSILKKAFSGQLVPQDSNDEPASELLKRITEEKAQMEATAKVAKAATRKPKKKVANQVDAKKKVKTQ